MALHAVSALLLACIVCQVSCSWLEVLRRGVTDSEQCDRISQALDNLWDAIPEDIQAADLSAGRPGQGPSGSLKDFLAASYAQYAPTVGFTTPSNNINTHEGRKEVACRLAGVHNLGDFLNLFNDNFPQYVLRRLYSQSQEFFSGDLGMAALQDLRELIKVEKYFLRIGGFPNFPLDIYDMDMARYIVRRTKAHTLAWQLIGGPNGNVFHGHTDEEWAQAIMSDSLEDAVQLLDMPVPPIPNPEEAKVLIGKMVRIYGTVPEGIDVVEALYEGGFFGPTATAD